MLPLTEGVDEALHKLESGYGILKRDALSRVGDRYPVRPRVLNFLANDICNAECQMCNIWKQEPETEITPEELSEVLSDRLFKRLDYVGVSGGEPTLRQDLPNLFRAIVETRPSITSSGLITNAMVPNVVIDRAEACGRICEENGINFNLMVSLDGVGEVHNRVRGTEGAFENAVKVIRYFRDETPFSVSIGCTATKDNVYNLQEVLEFAKREDVRYKFRVAEFIKRLYNDDRGDKVRNFSDREAYHLGLFFAKLEDEASPFGTRQRTYRNIKNMLLCGENRSIGCYMQSHGATLDSHGQLSYCAPKSPKLGDCLDASPTDIYRDNMDVRDQIKSEHCDDCIHDYPSPKLTTELTYLPKQTYWEKRLSLEATLAEENIRSQVDSVVTPRQEPSDPDDIFVFGWYGTETAGDKAILGQILHDLTECHPDATIRLGSLYPYLSEWTVQELGYPDVEVIHTYSSDFVDAAELSDKVIMGGGPLMHIGTLGIVLKAFSVAKRADNWTRIAGCGIGPLHRGEKYERTVASILHLSDSIELRNQESVEAAEELVDRADIENVDDPAFEYVRRWDADNDPPNRKPVINCYLRDWPAQYKGGLSDAEFEELKSGFESELGKMIRSLCDRHDARPRLLPMSYFYIGDDDRIFARRFADEHLDGLDPILERRPISVQEVMTSMQEGILSVCMRYHSVAFASELREEFTAIDYSRGGKIERYLTETDQRDRMVSIDDIAAGDWQSVCNNVAPTSVPRDTD